MHCGARLWRWRPRSTSSGPAWKVSRSLNRSRDVVSVYRADPQRKLSAAGALPGVHGHPSVVAGERCCCAERMRGNGFGLCGPASTVDAPVSSATKAAIPQILISPDSLLGHPRLARKHVNSEFAAESPSRNEFDAPLRIQYGGTRESSRASDPVGGSYDQSQCVDVYLSCRWWRGGTHARNGPAQEGMGGAG